MPKMQEGEHIPQTARNQANRQKRRERVLAGRYDYQWQRIGGPEPRKGKKGQ